jgi:hypothetical protein
LQKCLRLRERVLSPDDPDIAIPRTHLAVIHRKQREDVEAAKLFERAFYILESGPHAPNLYMSLTLSGQGDLFAVQGAWGEAAKAFKRALQFQGNTREDTSSGAGHDVGLCEGAGEEHTTDEARMYQERVRDALAHSGDIVAAGQNTVDVGALRAAGPSGRF